MEFLNWDTYKFRASQLGEVVTATGKLTKKAQTYLEKIYIKEVYNREKEIVSKYLQKGVESEQASIDLYNSLHNTNYKKNEKHFDNEYLTGTPDIITDDLIIDIKTAWDIYTYTEVKKIEHNYKMQLIAYMLLTNRTKAKLVYTLVDTPDYLIQREANKMMYSKTLTMQEEQEVYDEYERQMTYSDIPKEKRIKEFDIELKKGDEEKIIMCVEQARKYLKDYEL